MVQLHVAIYNVMYSTMVKKKLHMGLIIQGSIIKKEPSVSTLKLSLLCTGHRTNTLRLRLHITYNVSHTGSHCISSQFIWGRLKISPQSATDLTSFITITDQNVQAKIDNPKYFNNLIKICLKLQDHILLQEIFYRPGGPSKPRTLLRECHKCI